MRGTGARLLLAFGLGLFGDIVVAGQEGTDMKLEDAGFVMRRADTAEKVAHAKLLPPRKIMARTKDGKRYYVYSDPDFCKCVFVGDERALQAWRDMRLPAPQLSQVLGPDGVQPRQMMIEDIDHTISNTITGDGHILDWKF